MKSELIRRTRFMAVRTALLGLALAPAVALAHEEIGQAAGFLSGLSHPVSGLDHVLAMVAVGLWGAVLGPPAIWVLPVAFPLVMAVGGLMGLLGVPVPGVEIGIAVSAIVLGVMVLAEVRPAIWVAAAIVAFFAIFHGHAHGRELPAGTSALLYSLGFVVATGLLHAVGIVLGVAHRWAAGRQAVRVAGGGVALAGLFFLWRAIA
jgi:urease accessory protein